MPQQNNGWAGTPWALMGRGADNAFSRNLLLRIGAPEAQGGRKDDLWAYHDIAGIKREMGPGSPAPSNVYVGSGASSHSFGGGSTSSDPGKRNWATLKRNAGRVSDVMWGAVDWRRESRAKSRAREAQEMQDTMNNYRKAFDPDYDISSVYNQVFQQYQANVVSQNAQKMSNAYQNAYGQPDPFSGAYQDMVKNAGTSQVKTMAGAPMQASQNATAGLFAQNNPTPIAGASSPIRGRKNAPVNLLNPPGTASTAPASPPLPAPSAAPVAKSRTQGRKAAPKNTTSAPKKTPKKP